MPVTIRVPQADVCGVPIATVSPISQSTNRANTILSNRTGATGVLALYDATLTVQNRTIVGLRQQFSRQTSPSKIKQTWAGKDSTLGLRHGNIGTVIGVSPVAMPAQFTTMIMELNKLTNFGGWHSPP